MAERLNPSDVWQPFGAFSMVAIQEGGRVAHLKGQVPLDSDGRIVGPGEMRTQLRQVLNNISAVMAGLGGELSDIFALTNHTTNIDAFMEASDVRAEFFRPPFPITTTVEVVRLYHPDILVEVTAIAEIPEKRLRR